MPEPDVVEMASEAADLCECEEAAGGTAAARPPMIHSDTKDSISSVESEPEAPAGEKKPAGEKSEEAGEEDERANLADQSDTGSEEGAKDSGCEEAEERPKKRDEPKDEAEEPFVAPDDELVRKIIDQVEFYFSDVNITKDAFLLKHVKRNKEGYVSLKLISSFKRVKHIAKDWRVVAYALAKSDKLQINELGTKLRRVDPLPAYDQTTPSRTVVAIDLPLEKPTIENVAELFRGCGEIALIRVLRPGNPIPADVRHFVNKHPEMNGAVSALVEFVRTESAHNAVNRQDWARGCEHAPPMRVIELNAPPSADRKKRATPGKKSAVQRLCGETEYSSSCASGSEAEDMRHWRRMQRRCSSPHQHDHWAQRRWSRDSGSDSPASSFSRSRSNSGVMFGDIRRMSAGWDSGSDSYSSGRSRSNSGVSIDRRFSVKEDCCCCHYDCGGGGGGGGRRMSYGRDSGSEGYGSNRSRCDSGASDLIKRKDSGEYYYPGRRVSFGKQGEPEGPFCPRPRLNSSGSGVSVSEQLRRISIDQVKEFRPRSVVQENVVRLPRGPDGGRGFAAPAPACHTLVE